MARGACVGKGCLVHATTERRRDGAQISLRGRRSLSEKTRGLVRVGLPARAPARPHHLSPQSCSSPWPGAGRQARAGGWPWLTKRFLFGGKERDKKKRRRVCGRRRRCRVLSQSRTRKQERRTHKKKQQSTNHGVARSQRRRAATPKRVGPGTVRIECGRGRARGWILCAAIRARARVPVVVSHTRRALTHHSSHNKHSERGLAVVSASPGVDLAGEVDALRAEVRRERQSIGEGATDRRRRRRICRPRPSLTHTLPHTHATPPSPPGQGAQGCRRDCPRQGRGIGQLHGGERKKKKRAAGARARARRENGRLRPTPRPSTLPILISSSSRSQQTPT